MNDLRDEIAITAMAALIVSGKETLSLHTEEGTLVLPSRQGVPKIAYMYADEMLKARTSNE